MPETRFSRYPSALGGIVLACDGDCLTGLWFEGQRYFPPIPDGAFADGPLPVFAQTERWLDLYFRGIAPDFTPPLRMDAAPFRRAVWEYLLTIPYGRTVTYGEIARAVGGSPRAVGGAVGRNPISLIVPCHRVVGADGSLTGYAGGLARKLRLLSLEGADPARLRIPADLK